MYSVLQNKKNMRYTGDPYPYFVIDDALPSELYESLNNNFPKYEKIIKFDRSQNSGSYKENTAYRLSAIDVLTIKSVSDEWKEFIRYHTSSLFTDDLFDIFKDSIKKIYNLDKQSLPNQQNMGVRGSGKYHFKLDCQFVINTPTSGETTVIGPHLDNPKEFYAALLYMKNDDDISTGGNLTTHKFINKPIFHGKARVRDEHVNLIEEIEYKQNRLVVFLNSLRSIHGVTKRSKTSSYRKYINMIGEFNNQLFDFHPFLENN